MIEYCNLFNFWYLWYNLEILAWTFLWIQSLSNEQFLRDFWCPFIAPIMSLENKSFFQGKWLLKVPCNSFFFSFFWKIIVWSFHASWGILKSYHRIVSIKIQKLILKKSKILKKYHLSLLASKFYVDSFKNSTSFWSLPNNLLQRNWIFGTMIYIKNRIMY